MALTLQVQPVYYAREPDHDWLPGKEPYAHQREVYRLTLEALERGEFLCVFNTSATGGGKTFANFAYPLKHRKPVVGIYPTNELVADQCRALTELAGELANGAQLHHVDSRTLDKWEAEIEAHGHPHTLETILNWQDAVLTNPDLVYLTFFGLYARSEQSPGLNQRLHQVLADYPLFVFDEFHLYNVKQVGNVATMIGAMHAVQPERGKVFLFASATPAPLLLEALQRLNIRTETVQAQEVLAESPGVYCVAHPVKLIVLPSNLSGWQALETLTAEFDRVREFLAAYPEAKSVFILDAVADAMRLAAQLRAEFGVEQVGEVHGLSSAVGRREALRRRHTVGTATIEVGIDLRGDTEKDLLVFEAKTAAQFIQRFGRLARHLKSTTVPNRAIALVPQYVYEFLRDQLGESAGLTRSKLTALLEDGYRSVNQFCGYFKRYTPVEAFEARNFISHQMQPDDYSQVKVSLDSMITALSQREIDGIAKEYAWLRGHELLAPLHTFRGTGFDVALIDKTETTGCPLKTYDVFFVLRRTKFQELLPGAFWQEVKWMEQDFPQEIASQRRRLGLIGPEPGDLLGLYGYFQVAAVLDDPRKVWLETYQSRVREMEKLTTITGLYLAAEGTSTSALCEINRLLSKKPLVCWIGRQKPWTIQFTRGLPPLFEIYELRVKGSGGRVVATRSIAFGQNAYFLDCLRWQPPEDELLEESTKQDSEGSD